jgi:hypothetical protein
MPQIAVQGAVGIAGLPRFYRGRADVEKPAPLLGGFNPDGNSDIETGADEFRNQLLVVVDPGIYQSFRIHRITPFTLSVVAR